jgi:hypothetical protein
LAAAAAEEGHAVSNLPAVTILQEIDEIETLMRTDRALYNRDEGLQQRYRGLLAQKAGSAPTVLSGGDTAPLMPIASLAEYKSVHGVSTGYDQYVKLVRLATDWVFALPANEQREFIADFEALPDDVTDALLEEIVAHPPHVPPSSSKAVLEFSKLPEGAVLAREWGSLVGVNLAIVRARLFRVAENIPERSLPAFMDWLNGLSTDCAIAIYRKLVD